MSIEDYVDGESFICCSDIASMTRVVAIWLRRFETAFVSLPVFPNFSTAMHACRIQPELALEDGRMAILLLEDRFAPLVSVQFRVQPFGCTVEAAERVVAGAGQRA